MQHNLLINGKLVAGEGEVLPVFNPANGEAIIEIAEATEAQVDAAVNAGRSCVCQLEPDNAENSRRMFTENG